VEGGVGAVGLFNSLSIFNDASSVSMKLQPYNTE
jgi:hypothetical protein